MGKQRAYGADATLKAVRETQYGGATGHHRAECSPTDPPS